MASSYSWYSIWNRAIWWLLYNVIDINVHQFFSCLYSAVSYLLLFYVCLYRGFIWKKNQYFFEIYFIRSALCWWLAVTRQLSGQSIYRTLVIYFQPCFYITLIHYRLKFVDMNLILSRTIFVACSILFYFHMSRNFHFRPDSAHSCKLHE